MNARPDPTTLPTALRRAARWERLVDGTVPAMLALPEGAEDRPVPTVVWMHGRTVNKELDPGRYLRWIRAGFGACAVDLPGHGERFEERLQHPEAALEVVLRMRDEIDPIVSDLVNRPGVDGGRLAIGGMSAGGMAVLSRLCRAHGFTCASVEATSGSWADQKHRRMFRKVGAAALAELDPISHLSGWRPIPLQAFHSRADQWVAYDGQARFVGALRSRYPDPDLVELVTYESTGAPHEHAGFGRHSADAKNRQRDFLVRRLA